MLIYLDDLLDDMQKMIVAVILLVFGMSIVCADIPQVTLPIAVQNGIIVQPTETVSWYKPPCLSCGINATPTPTPVPATKVDIDFTIPPKVRCNNAFTVTATQLSGPLVTNGASWNWMYKQGSAWYGRSGVSMTITPNIRTTNYIVKLQLRDNENNLYGDVSKSTIVK